MDSRAGKYMEASNVDYTQLAEFATAPGSLNQAKIDKFPRKRPLAMALDRLKLSKMREPWQRIRYEALTISFAK
jgi:hypothetical protein